MSNPTQRPCPIDCENGKILRNYSGNKWRKFDCPNPIHGQAPVTPAESPANKIAKQFSEAIDAAECPICHVWGGEHLGSCTYDPPRSPVTPAQPQPTSEPESLDAVMGDLWEAVGDSSTARKLEARITALIESRVAAGRLIELDLLEQAINANRDMRVYKSERLALLTHDYDQINQRRQQQ